MIVTDVFKPPPIPDNKANNYETASENYRKYYRIGKGIVGIHDSEKIQFLFIFDKTKWGMSIDLVIKNRLCNLFELERLRIAAQSGYV